jgi:hypothetical protein
MLAHAWRDGLGLDNWRFTLDLIDGVVSIGRRRRGDRRASVTMDKGDQTTGETSYSVDHTRG